MRNCLLFIFLVLSVQFYSQNLCELNIKGKVSEYEEIKYNVISGIPEDDFSIIGIVLRKFDENGEQIGNERGDFTYDYDGNLPVNKYANNKGKSILLNSFKYQNGKLVEKKHYCNGKNVEQVERFSYYNEGWAVNLINRDNVVVSRFFVDERNRQVTIEEAEVLFLCKYKDFYWRPHTAKMFTCKGCKRREARLAILKYDRQGNLQYVSNYVRGIRVNGEEVSSSANVYDTRVNYAMRYVYEYDNFGNWILRKCYDNEGKLLEKKQRKYTYREEVERNNTYY